MNTLTGIRVLVTGVGMKLVRHIFHDTITGTPTHLSIVENDGSEYKANVGAATALACARAGASVHIVSRSKEKLDAIARWILSLVPNADIAVSPVDLGDTDQIHALTEKIPDNLPLYWVQSVGLGAGSVCIPNDNPYLPISSVPRILIEAELSVVPNTIILLQSLLPRFRKQAETRICIISSMSAIRGVVRGSVHNASKGALGRFANAAMLELAPENIFVTDIRPGAIDTGLYDAPGVQESVREICRGYGRKDTGFAPPSTVADAIVLALSSQAHFPSINLVARGQFPHEGS
ncbi:MAG: SDR family oxidoreductase [Candidatus Moranbacteria bacterium]|nr:SDR family oxidoreductase [Candidatus Moranbacteria bacterium]